AESAFRFVVTEMADGKRLRHSWCDGRAQHPAVIEDYANMAAAALALHEATADAAYLARAEGWVAIADAHYWDTADGGYFMNADDTTDLIARPKPIHDNATPPGNGTMAEVLARLWLLSGVEAYRDRLTRLLTTLTPPEADKAIHQLSMLMGFELMDSGTQIVVAGELDQARPLLDAAYRHAPPARLIVHVAPDADLPDAHPAAGKGPVDGRAAAYVCVGATCTLPLTDAQALEDHLRTL
ncbi:MAG: thioredoxin domain-containing protein, partial [Rhodospirillaceae bacterium]